MADPDALRIVYRGFTLEIVAVRGRYSAGWCDCGGQHDGLSPPGSETPGGALDLVMHAIDQIYVADAAEVMAAVSGKRPDHA